MNSRKLVKVLFKKEIKDIFRDKKSVLMMFFVPVVLYPLIFFIAFLVISLIQTGVGTQTYNVVISGNDGSALESRLLNPDEDKTDTSVINPLKHLLDTAVIHINKKHTVSHVSEIGQFHTS